MTIHDAFSILGLHPNTILEEGKKHFRQLAKQHHPDKGGDEDIFKLIASAWDIVRPLLPEVAPTPQPQGPRVSIPHGVVIIQGIGVAMFKNGDTITFTGHTTTDQSTGTSYTIVL